MPKFLLSITYQAEVSFANYVEADSRAEAQKDALGLCEETEMFGSGGRVLDFQIDTIEQLPEESK